VPAFYVVAAPLASATSGWMVEVTQLIHSKAKSYLFPKAYRLALRRIRHIIQQVNGVISSAVKWLGNEHNSSLPNSVKVKNAWSYTTIPTQAFMEWYSMMHRENFTFQMHYPFYIGTNVKPA
jgi:hypothetical protein